MKTNIILEEKDINVVIVALRFSGQVFLSSEGTNLRRLPYPWEEEGSDPHEHEI